jgi:hypothetical protein
VFEHLDEPLVTLEHLCNALKPNGLMRLAVPNGWAIKDSLRFWELDSPVIPDESQSPFQQGFEHSLNPVSPFEHINCYDHDALLNLAARSGLTPVNIPSWLVIASSAKQTLPARVKAALRQRYYAMRAASANRTSTDLIFRKNGDT